MTLILGTNSIKDTGFDIANSLRFDDGSSAYLHRSLGSQSSLRIGTFSYWVKRSSLGIGIIYFNEVENDNNRGYIQFESDDTWRMVDNDAGGDHIVLKTNRLFRDFSSWYHICVRIDTTQSTNTDRVRLYVNGVQETSFSSTTYPSQNDDLKIFQGGQTNKNNLGAGYPASNYYDGYMAEFVYCDGQSLAPTSFGEFDEDSGIWKPIDVSGLTFGNNGFYLDFENASSLGADVSGNGNNFTVNNLTSVDQSSDTCTNNFATFNPLFVYGSSAISPSYSDGNLTAIFDNGSENEHSPSTFAVSSGKWYAEFKWVSATGDGSTHTGVLPADANVSSDLNAQSYAYLGNGNKRLVNTASSYGATYGSGDIISIALNCDDNQITFYKNGASQGALSIASNKSYFMYMSDYASSGNRSVDANFGTPETSVSSGNTDGNGYGNFEYSVPSGYYSLNTKNLAEYG